jgi:EAL domain-containing protein (putative c-di-GMP-specific phosphodiesterase class I)
VPEPIDGRSACGILRLLVSDTGRVDGIDVLGAVVGVPQLGAALIAGYHPDDIETITAHLGTLTARNGAVAHWDARVRHRDDWVWVYEYAIGRGLGAVDLIRVFPGRPGTTPSTPAAGEPVPAPDVVIVITTGTADAPAAELARGIESILESWTAVIDDWVLAPDGGYRAVMRACGLPQAEVVAGELSATLARVLGAAAGQIMVKAMTVAGSVAETCPVGSAPSGVESGAVPVRAAEATEATGGTAGAESRARPASPGVLVEYAAGLLPALSTQRLLLHIQPITRIGPEAGEPVVAAEFLLRVRNGDGAVERPGLRLLETERNGGMHRVDRWVVSQAFALLTRWPEALARLEFVTINLSGPSLGQPDFLAHVLRQFLETGLPPSKVCFEITETAAIPDVRQACMLIEALQRRGCRFAIDDFGAGLASFHLLRALPVDLLKLDGRLFREPLRQMGLLCQLQHLGERLGKRTVAEHVETPTVRAALRQIGVDYAQGHLFGEPEAPEDFFGRLNRADR